MFSIILLFFCLGCVPLHSQGFILEKNITVAEDEVQDNVVTFGGTLLIKGKVREDAIAFGGTIIVEGEVGQAVVGFGADIYLKSTATIKGDVVSLGGMLDKEPGTTVSGDTIHFDFESSEDMRRFLKESMFGVFGLSLIPLLIVIKLIATFLWFILAVVITAIFPRQISYASSQIRKSFWSIFGIGFLSIIIFIGLVIFSTLLSFILIGIPILLCLIILAIFIKIFSRVVLFYFFGESLSKGFGKKQPSPLWAVILGFLLLSFIGFIPILGSLISFVLSIIGWGVVIKTKFGTAQNNIKKA